MTYMLRLKHNAIERRVYTNHHGMMIAQDNAVIHTANVLRNISVVDTTCTEI